MENTELRRKGYLLRLMVAIFAVGFVISIFTTISALAAANLFKIQNAELTELSDTVEGSISNFDETNIVSDVTFNRLNDSVKYTITLKNTDSEGHIIESITDDNENPHVVYEYDQHSGEQVDAGADLVFAVTIKYMNAVADTSQRVQANNVKFFIHFADTDEEILIVPNTGASSNASDHIQFSVLSLVISAIGLVIIGVVVLKKNKKACKFIAVGTIAVAAISMTAIAKAAATEADAISIDSTLIFHDRLVVTYIIDGNSETEPIDYGAKISRGLPAKTGYLINGWTREDGAAFDADTEIFDDITLIADYKPITYTVAFDGNGAKKGSMEPQTFTYDVAQALSTNAFKLHGYGLDKWTTTEDGEGGQFFANAQEVKNLTAEDGAMITLYAQWKSMPCNPNATDIEDAVCLQDANNQVLMSMPYDEQYVLRDSRDGRNYDVMRLIDGNMWMQEDLELVDITISSADSNMPEGRSFTIPASDITAFDTDGTSHSAAYYDGQQGAFYNFYTANAGWQPASTNDESTMDICPKGWRMPTPADTVLLADLYDWDQNILTEKYRPVSGGWAERGTIRGIEDDGNSWGYVWNSRGNGNTQGTSAADYLEYWDGEYAYWPGGSIVDKYEGHKVRCVFNRPSMQDFNKNTNSYTISDIGDWAYLEDVRWSAPYEVKKLADGNIWMINNLKTFNATPVTSKDTNIPEGETYTTGGHFRLSNFAVGNNPGYSNTVSYEDYNHEEYGGYFNFNHVTLGWAKEDGTSGNAPRDICPRGWRLPTESELTNLVNSYSTQSELFLDARLVLAGHVVNGEMQGQGELLDLWTSNMDSSKNGFSFTITNGLAPSITTSDVVVNGKSVRCIAK